MSPAGSGNTRQSLCQNRELMWRVRVHCGADRRHLSALWSTLILSVVAYHLQLWFILVILAAEKNAGCNCVISVQCHYGGHYNPYYVMSHGRQMKCVYAWVSSILTLHRNAQYIIVYSQQLLLELQMYLLLCNWAVVSAISPRNWFYSEISTLDTCIIEPNPLSISCTHSILQLGSLLFKHIRFV